MSVPSSVRLSLAGRARRGLAFLVSAVCLASLAPRAFGGAYSVDPVRVSLSARAPLASMMVRNTGSEPSVLQVETVSWSQSAGRVTLEPTRDVLATPPLFTIPPGGTQLIRLGLRRPADAQRELTYRIILHEVLAPAPDTKGMRVALDVSIPIFVKPLVPCAPSVQWHLSRSADGEFHLDATNSGTAHIRLETLEIAAAGDRSTEKGIPRSDNGATWGDRGPWVRQGLSAYLLVNETRGWTLESGRLTPESGVTIAPGPLILRAKTDVGDIESRVQLESASVPHDAAVPTPVAQAP